MYTYLTEKSYYIVKQMHIDQFTYISEELKQHPLYVDLCKTILRPECQLFFDLYIFFSNDKLSINYNRTLNIPIYSFLNELVSKNKSIQQFKAQYSEDKHMCMMTSMYVNKTLQHLLAEILVALHVPLERVMQAIELLESIPFEQQNKELIEMQGVILSELKGRFQHEDYFNLIMRDAIYEAKQYSLQMQLEKS